MTERTNFELQRLAARALLDISFEGLADAWKHADEIIGAGKPDHDLEATRFVHAKICAHGKVEDDVLEGYVWDMAYDEVRKRVASVTPTNPVLG